MNKELAEGASSNGRPNEVAVEEQYEEVEWWFVLQNTETGEVLGRQHLTMDEVVILNWDYKQVGDPLRWVSEVKDEVHDTLQETARRRSSPEGL